MKRMLPFALVALLLTSCSFLSQAEAVLGEVRTTVASLKTSYQQADRNQDGRVDRNELLMWLLGSGGIGTIFIAIRNYLSNSKKEEDRKVLARLQAQAESKTTLR